MTIIASNVPSENGHFYSNDGKPAYTIIGANGKERNTTLRDARKFNLFPSVTTIIRVAAAPGLIKWKTNQILLSAATLPKIEGEALEDWMKRVELDAQEQSKAARSLGTSIHASLEKAYGLSPRSYEAGHQAYVEGVQEALLDYFGRREWYAEESFAHPLGFGGKSDLSAEGIVIDFKTKAFSKDELPECWPEHKVQLGAYRVGLKQPKAQGFIVFVSTTEPGLVHVVEIEENDLTQGFEMFKHLLSYWQVEKGYVPE